MPATIYNEGFSDAESVNNSKRSTYKYQDLNLFFSRNPVTGDISTVSDVQDIKRAVRNIVLMNRWDKTFHPEIGTNLRAQLFQNITPPIINSIRNSIVRSVEKWESRVTIKDVSFGGSGDIDNNSLQCSIKFIINNAPESLEEIEVILTRVR